MVRSVQRFPALLLGTQQREGVLDATLENLIGEFPVSGDSPQAGAPDVARGAPGGPTASGPHLAARRAFRGALRRGEADDWILVTAQAEWVRVRGARRGTGLSVVVV